MIAVSCGTPVPATIRVVHIEPGPIPTLTASAPAWASAFAPAAVATLPAITCNVLKLFFKVLSASITPLLWPCALSSDTISTPTCCKADALSSRSFVMPKAAPTCNLPKPSLPAFGKFLSCNISLKVMSPMSTPCLSTTGNFSILYFCKIFSAFFKSVPAGAVTRFSFVITSLTFFRLSFSKRRSRLVKIPASLLSSVTMGIPPILFSFISLSASPIVESTVRVNGSMIIPLSLLFTLRTCSACCSILMFL